MVVPSPDQSVRIVAGQYRIVTDPGLHVPADQVLVYYFCPCGRHRSHFTIYRNILLNYISRNQCITYYLHEQAYIHRMNNAEARAPRQLETPDQEFIGGLCFYDDDDIDR